MEFFIAKRQILQHKKQSFLSIFGISLGVIVLIVSIAISNGLNQNLVKNILSMTNHISLGNVGRIENYLDLKEKIEKIDGVKGAIPTIETQGIIRHDGELGQYVAGVKIHGYDLALGGAILDLPNKIVNGEINSENINNILVGQEFANVTKAKIGDEVIIISSENKEIKFKISGIFKCGYYDYDLNMVILPLKAVQYLMVSGDCVGNINVVLDNPYDADTIKDKIEKITDISGKTWGETNVTLLSALSLEKNVMILVFSLIVIVAGFIVWMTLNNIVREKIKYIGIMRSFGYSASNIMKIFLIHGGILGIIGIIFGLLISFFILYYLKSHALNFIQGIYYLTKIPIEISKKEVFVIVMCNLVVIFVSSIFPAYKASKLLTVEALRYE